VTLPSLPFPKKTQKEKEVTMWLGILVLMLNGNLQSAAEAFNTEAECKEAVAAVAQKVKDKNHPEITLLFGECRKVL
jgi:hypothetical protein